MSQIFDALLRSETERTGKSPVTQAEATDLLQSVEREVGGTWSSAGLLNGRDSDAEIEQDGFLSERLVSREEPITRQAEPFAAIGVSRYQAPDHRSGIWGEFHSVSGSLDSESRLVCLTDKGSPTAEAFRLLGVRLRELRQSRTLNKILVTSTVPREGKSTVAANLACTLAGKTGEKILLLEGDVRRPALSKIFKLEDISGLCECLRGQCSLQESIYHFKDAGIWVLPAGNFPASPLELLQSRKLPALMEQLATLFDWIVIDSPPVLPLADTSIWAQIADGILLVTRPGVTEKQQLKKGVQALESDKLIGALLNCSSNSTYSSYYYTPATSKPASN